jgi:sterol 3beta-glucosyltransferase
MRILILTLGSRGDVEPFVALGAALQHSGHAVSLTTAQGYGALVDRSGAGLNYAPLAVDLHALALTPEAQSALRSPHATLRLWRQLGPMMRRVLDGCWVVAQEVRPDVIVFHPKMLAGPHLAERLGIPALVAAAMPLLTPTSAFPSPILPFRHDLGAVGNRLSHHLVLAGLGATHRRLTNRWRVEALGLQPRALFAEDLSLHGRPIPRLHAYSPVLLPRPADWGPHNHVTGVWVLESDPPWVPPQDLSRFLADGPPPVYVGFGSMTGANASALTAAVLEALRRSGQRGLLAVGWGGLHGSSQKLPPNVHLIAEAPHDWLFPQVAVVVHHGGAGTTHAGLRAGRQTLICPVFGDQPFWGRRVHALGAGPTPIPQANASAESLAAAMDEMVGNQQMRARAEDIGRRMAADAGTEAAVAAIEACKLAA